MKLLLLPTNKLKPDPRQPRKFIDEDKVREMAVSIKNEGIINAIECDEKFNIITGEMRWRAAKVAGLKEVPVKVLEDEKTEGMPRFIRQMQENLHHNTMSVIDTAKALRKVADSYTGGLPNPKGGRPERNGAVRLSKLFGCSYQNISDLLNLLNEPEDIQEILRNRTKFPRTSLKEISRIPEQYRDQMKRKVINEEIPRDGARFIARKLVELDKEQNYKFANTILRKDFSGMETPEIISEVSRISSGVSYVSGDKEMVEQLEYLTNEVIRLLEQKPLSLLQGLNVSRVRTGLTLFIGILVEYLENEQKRLEIRKILELKK